MIEDIDRTALTRLVGVRAKRPLLGITSICSAHPLVIEAAFRQAIADDAPVLIEATCNQVNQDGGYTGMTPADFRRLTEGIARDRGFDVSQLILGGDHLGPNPWKSLPAEAAMAKAETMVEAFVAAGFGKIHLDCSMGCAGEPIALADAVTAQRAAQLARVAEATVRTSGIGLPVYIIGTEVPPPGGALEGLNHIKVTAPEAVLQTLEVHRQAFAEAGVADAFERVIGIVVQPGVEFGNADVAVYRPEKATDLSRALGRLPGLVFEAHSTDYQLATALRALVDDGFAILKVGPALTFALRETLYGLDRIAEELAGNFIPDSVEASLEQLMLAQPGHWRSHYAGTPQELRLLRHFSYSDRIRYYWPQPEAVTAVERLAARLDAAPIAETLISQYLPRLYPEVAAKRLGTTVRELCLAAIGKALDPYSFATAIDPLRGGKQSRGDASPRVCLR
jgi:D-tagatose-bisphosphate aldolase class II non-catalytic subunit